MRQYEDLLIDVLLDDGFSVTEAEQLIRLQERAELERRAEQRLAWLHDWPAHLNLRSIRDLYN